MKITNICITILTATFLAALTGCKENAARPEKIETEISFRKDAAIDIFRGDSLILSGLNVEIADDEYERQTGLMYRTSMEEKQGMFFIMDREEVQNFYMKNTEIGLDILYANSNFKIVSMAENAQPLNENSLSSIYPAKYTLELNAGSAKKFGIKTGDSIALIK